MMKRIIHDSNSIPLFIEELARGARRVGRASTSATSSDQRSASSASRLVPEFLARLAGGAARSSAAGAKRGANGGGHRAGIFLRHDPQRFVVDRLRSSIRRSPTSSRARSFDLIDRQDVPALRVQARAGARRRLRIAAQVQPRGDPCKESLRCSRRNGPRSSPVSPSSLAYHYSMAGNAEFAALYWLSGGRRARSRSANLEAIVQFQKALEFLELLPNSPDRTAKELEIQLSLGLCFIAVRGYPADDTRKSFERASSLSVELGEPLKEIQCHLRPVGTLLDAGAPRPGDRTRRNAARQGRAARAIRCR